jgi:hypothetical protein
MTVVIQLNNPEPIQTTAYYKLCAWKLSVPRPDLGVKGWVECWLAKCYRDAEGKYVETEGLTGIYIKIDDDSLIEQLDSIQTTIKPLAVDSAEIISQFLIDNGLVPAGEVITE